MELGAFSVSLSVADIEKSRAFYAALGFAAIGGEADQGWLIMRNGSTTIGLFQGMFEKNLLTFNPGWDAQCATMCAQFNVSSWPAASNWPTPSMKKQKALAALP